MTSLTHSLMATFCGSAMSSAGHDPGADRAGAVEILLAQPVELERRGVGDLRPLGEVARREIVADGVAGDVVERALDRHVARRPADDGGELRLPVDHLGIGRQRRPCCPASARQCDALMKCHGLSPTLCGSGSGAMFCTFAISSMWSVKFAPAQKIAAGLRTGASSFVPRSGRPPLFRPRPSRRCAARRAPTASRAARRASSRRPAARCGRDVVHRFSDDDAGARPVRRLIRHQLVVQHARYPPIHGRSAAP